MALFYKLFDPKVKKPLRYLLHFWILNLFIFEVVVFHFSFLSCQWPALDSSHSKSPLKAILIGDPQVTDSFSYDYPRYIMPVVEFYSDIYMKKNFRLLQFYFNFDAVFFLGDLFDGGREQKDDKKWKIEYDRMMSIFRKRKGFEVIYLAGNHDIGITENKYEKESKRFQQYFGALNQFVEMKGIKITFLNTLGYGTTSGPKGVQEYNNFKNSIQNRLPTDILFSHIPLFRPDYSDCGPWRSTINPYLNQGHGTEYQNIVFRRHTAQIFEDFSPSLIFSGDDHDFCYYPHNKFPKIEEYTIATFSWVQGNLRPSFALLVAEKNDGDELNFKVLPCYLPNQLYIYFWYIGAFVSTLLILTFSLICQRRTPLKYVLDSKIENKMEHKSKCRRFISWIYDNTFKQYFWLLNRVLLFYIVLIFFQWII